MASIFAFPTYAQTNVTAGAVTDIQRPVDIVNATIRQVTAEVKKAETKAQADKKAAKAKKETQAETKLQTQTTETEAAQTETYKETQAQTEAAETETETQKVTETETETQAETKKAAQKKAKKQTKTETQAQTEEETEAQSNSSSSYSGEVLNARNGMVNGPSGLETYYNLDMSGVVANMKSMGIRATYWVRDDGVKMYGDYVMVAANLDVHPYGSVVETTLGTAMVVDTGDFAEENPYQLDVAVNW